MTARRSGEPSRLAQRAQDGTLAARLLGAAGPLLLQRREDILQRCLKLYRVGQLTERDALLAFAVLHELNQLREFLSAKVTAGEHAAGVMLRRAGDDTPVPATALR